ncbi:MAG: hypothetical protein ABF289_10075 [Clostridiales bacterium]
MKIKNIAKNFVSTAFKLLWAVLCYFFSILLAIVSAFFTITFYSDGSIGYDSYIMGFFAISLEGIKLILSFGYPYIRGRDKKYEDKILLILKISFFISILSNVYYLMLGSDIEKSPASRTVAMLFNYISVLNIIPLKFAQFTATISLSVLVEYLIIYLPMLAPIIFTEKKPYEDKNTTNNFEKIKEIVTIIPDMFINTIHKKTLEFANKKYSSQKIIEIDDKPKLKILKRLDTVQDSDSQKLNNINKVIKLDRNKSPVRDSISSENENSLISNDTKTTMNLNSVQDSDSDFNMNIDKKLMLKAIFKLKEDDICPSVKQIETEIGFTKNLIHDLKKEFEELDIIKTLNNKTVVLCTYKKALEKINKEGSDKFEK